MIITDPNIINFKTKNDIDKNHSDNEMVRYMGKDISLGKLRHFFAEKDKTCLKNMIIFYDDIFQYTSIGLLDIIFDLKKIEAPIPIDDFFKRTCTGNVFVKRICKLFKISAEEVDEIEKTYYMEILMRSPFSINAKSFIDYRKNLRSQLIVFRHNCNGLSEIFSQIGDKIHAMSDYTSMEMMFTDGKSEKEFLETYPKSLYNKLELCVIQDGGSVMDFINANTLDIGANILTLPLTECFKPEQIDQILRTNDGYGFGDYVVKFMKEGVAYVS